MKRKSEDTQADDCDEDHHSEPKLHLRQSSRGTDLQTPAPHLDLSLLSPRYTLTMNCTAHSTMVGTKTVGVGLVFLLHDATPLFTSPAGSSCWGLVHWLKRVWCWLFHFSPCTTLILTSPAGTHAWWLGVLVTVDIWLVVRCLRRRMGLVMGTRKTWGLFPLDPDVLLNQFLKPFTRDSPLVACTSISVYSMSAIQDGTNDTTSCFNPGHIYFFLLRYLYKQDCCYACRDPQIKSLAKKQSKLYDSLEKLVGSTKD